MYPPTQPPAQPILTAKPFSRFLYTNHWFSICLKGCSVHFWSVHLRGDLYKGSCTAWAVRQHWTEGSEPSLPVGQWSVPVHPRHAGAPSPSVVRAHWSKNVFMMTTQPNLWRYSKMFTISCTQICMCGLDAKTDRICKWYKEALTREKQEPREKLYAFRYD